VIVSVAITSNHQSQAAHRCCAARRLATPAIAVEGLTLVLSVGDAQSFHWILTIHSIPIIQVFIRVLRKATNLPLVASILRLLCGLGTVLLLLFARNPLVFVFAQLQVILRTFGVLSLRWF